MALVRGGAIDCHFESESNPQHSKKHSLGYLLFEDA